MWIRLFLIGLGVVMMITGCNSLISQFFGTHKLRTLDLAVAAEAGLADADFVRLEGLVASPEYELGAALHGTDKDIVLFPLLSETQTGEQPEDVHFIGWTSIFDPDCIERGDCYDADMNEVQGLVRPPNPEKIPDNATWAERGYLLDEDVRYVQINREPLAWYWNLLLFLGGIGLPLATEYRAFKRKSST